MNGSVELSTSGTNMAVAKWMAAMLKMTRNVDTGSDPRVPA